MKYGFIYNEYENSSYYWEFIKILLKLSIIFFVSMYEIHIRIKGLLCTIIVLFYGILISFVKPYKHNDFNKLDVMTSGVCTITLVLGVFLYQQHYIYFIYMAYGIIAVKILSLII